MPAVNPPAHPPSSAPVTPASSQGLRFARVCTGPGRRCVPWVACPPTAACRRRRPAARRPKRKAPALPTARFVGPVRAARRVREGWCERGRPLLTALLTTFGVGEPARRRGQRRRAVNKSCGGGLNPTRYAIAVLGDTFLAVSSAATLPAVDPPVPRVATNRRARQDSRRGASNRPAAPGPAASRSGHRPRGWKLKRVVLCADNRSGRRTRKGSARS